MIFPTQPLLSPGWQAEVRAAFDDETPAHIQEFVLEYLSRVVGGVYSRGISDGVELEREARKRCPDPRTLPPHFGWVCLSPQYIESELAGDTEDTLRYLAKDHERFQKEGTRFK